MVTVDAADGISDAVIDFAIRSTVKACGFVKRSSIGRTITQPAGAVKPAIGIPRHFKSIIRE
jgi:hypothetical protein